MNSKSLVAALLESEGYAAFEYLGEKVFQTIGISPVFCRELPAGAGTAEEPIRLADSMPFLDNFLVDAEEFWNSGAEGRVESGRWIEESKAGGPIALEASAFRLDGKRILLIRNPQQRHEEEVKVFQSARESALEHERLLSEIQKKEILLHCIIHDLSQPLSAMRGCFSLLAAEKFSPKLQGLVEIGERQSQIQEDLIRGILEAFSSELAAQNSIQRDSGIAPDLAACAREIVKDYSAAFAARGAAIQMDPSVDFTRKWPVAGDESRLRRIYTNLVENALRYSPAGSSVTLGVTAEGNFLRATVDDEGPGLPSDAPAARLFGLFAKGKEGGGKAGLGLYFCKITVERWGGTIGCENRPGKGTRFWFRLPRARAEAAAREKEVQAAKSAGKSMVTGTEKSGESSEGGEAMPKREKPLRILVAEDNPVNRELMVLMLERQGHRVVAVEDGQDVLRELEKGRPDIVIMDEEMPRMSGLEATRAIREKEKSAGGHIPIITVTGNATEADQRRGREAGADAYLAKPIHVKELFRSVAELCGGAGVEAAREPEGASAAGASEEAALLERLGGNAKVLRELAGIFLSDTPKRMRAIREAIRNQNAHTVAATAHSLKGSAGIFGAKEIVEEARKMEALGRSGKLEGASEMFSSLESKVAAFQAALSKITAEAAKKKARPGAKGITRLRRRR